MSEKPDLSALFGSAETSSFLGLKKCTDIRKLNAAIALIGIPCATPYKTVVHTVKMHLMPFDNQ